MSGEKCKIIIWDISAQTGSLIGKLDAIKHLALSKIDSNAATTKILLDNLHTQVDNFYQKMACCGIDLVTDDPS